MYIFSMAPFSSDYSDWFFEVIIPPSASYGAFVHRGLLAMGKPIFALLNKVRTERSICEVTGRSNTREWSVSII